MAFQLGQFIAKLMGDSSHLNQAIDASKAKIAGLGDSLRGAAGRGVGDMGTGALTKGLGHAHTAAQSLGQQLLSLSGIDLGTILRLGTITGLAAAIGTATKKFMDLQDEVRNVGNRFRMLGLDAEEGTKNFFAFGKQMSESFGMAQSEARKLGMEMMQRGNKPERFREMAASAIGFGEALGVGTQQAARLVQQIEAGNYQMLRRYPQFRQMIEQGASRQMVEQKVNELIEQGTILAKERSNSFSGQLTRLKNSFTDLGVAAANAIGPAFAPIVMKLANAMQALVKRVEAFLTVNKESLGSNIRMVAGLAAAAAGYGLLSGKIGALGGMISSVIPGFGLLRSVLGSLLGFNPLTAAIKGLGVFRWALTGLIGAVTSTVTGMISAFAPLKIMGLVGALALAPLKIAMGGLAVATWAAAIPVLIVKAAFIALGAAIGALIVGLGVGLVAAFAGVEDTFGSTASGAQGLGEVLQQVWGKMIEWIAPVWEWIQSEGMIVFKALVASARQLLDGMGEVWGLLVKLWGDAATYFRSNFAGVFSWFEQTFGNVFGSIEEMWAEFTAELAVVGLRIKQITLGIIWGLAAIPTVIQWLGTAFESFGNWVHNRWALILIDAVNVVWEAIKLLGTAISDVGLALVNALEGRGFNFNFDATEKQFGLLKEKATQALSGLEIPGMDLSNVAPEIQNQLKGVNDQINQAKEAARSAQDKDRTNRQNRSTGSTSGGGAGDTKGGVLIGGKDKAHFSDVAGFWKKLQEAAASQRVEYVMQQQLTQQQEMVRILNALHAEAVAKRDTKWSAAAGGVVPR